MIKRSNKALTAAVIIVIVMLECVALFLCFAIYTIATNKMDAGKINRSISINMTATGNGISPANETTQDETEFNWHDSIDDALGDVSMIEEMEPFSNYYYFIDHPFFTYEQEDKTLIFYYRDILEQKDRLTLGFCLNFYKKDGKYSQPYCISRIYMGPQYYNGYTYDLCDTVSEEISEQMGFMPITDFISSGGYKAYCGEWDNYEELSSLTIDGNTVNEIIPIEVEGKTYYFWYYDKSDLKDNLETISFSNYTLNDVTAALNLQYTPTQVEEQ